MISEETIVENYKGFEISVVCNGDWYQVRAKIKRGTIMEYVFTESVHPGIFFRGNMENKIKSAISLIKRDIDKIPERTTELDKIVKSISVDIKSEGEVK